MPLSVNASRDTLQPLTPSEDRRRIGRYVAVGAVLTVTLLTLYHVLLRDASTIAGVCIPTTIMACYVLWIVYTVRRDKRKARLLASAMQVTGVIITEANDMNVERTRTMKQILGHEITEMIALPGKSLEIRQSSRTHQTNEIEMINDNDEGSIMM